MLARIILGATAGYALYLVVVAISLSDQSNGGFSSLQEAMIFYWGSFDPFLVVPTLVGAVAGYCWYVLASGRDN